MGDMLAESPGPRRYVLAVMSDLIFETKAAATARAAGVDVRTVRSLAAALPLAADAGGIIVDMHLPQDAAVNVIRELRRLRPQVAILAFCSHVQKELLEQATAAGASEVLPRSRFTRQLAAILQRLSAAAE